MDIQKLQLLVTEDEANRLLSAHLPAGTEVEELTLRLTPEGVVLSGKYPTLLLRVSFQTVWSLAVLAGGDVEARLASLRVAGLPAGKLAGVLFAAVRDAVADRPGVRIDGEVIRVSPNELLRGEGLPLRVTLTRIICGEGRLTIAAGDVG
jgi:hypothetical protein